MNKRDMHERHVAKPPAERPVMVFDGDCGFCRFWIERWRGRTGASVDYEPFQKVAADYPEIPSADFESAVQLIEMNGKVSSGADAVFRALEFSERQNRALCALLAVQGFAAAARGAYRFVARNRAAASFLTRLLFGKSLHHPTYLFARWIFLRALGVVFLIAFASLLVQIRGLVGKHGILPAAEFLDTVRGQVGGECYRLLPTLCWIDAGDPFLIFLCGAGAAISCALILGFAPSACLVLLWALYLSLVSVGQVFLGFQWDALLLEAGFLAIFLTPLQLWPDWKIESRGSRIARWLMLWLLFRLMFESGVVKLASGDETWRNLSALTYHYETQPLPVWTSWYANQAPLWFQNFSCLAMFAIELAAPFSIFGPRNIRRAGSTAMIALQLLIAATGNYCFFNLLTIALCVLLLDDEVWPRRWREKFLTTSRSRGLEWWPWILGPVAAVNLVLSAVQLFGTFRVRTRWPEPVVALYNVAEPFRTFNNYGLFAVMTTSRPEIIIEGSNDGEHWLPYEFKWKPGALNRSPRLVAPYQPRLDWQMWFAALGRFEDNPWFANFLGRLLQGSPEILDLLASNPFPSAPPRFVHAVMYEYHFTRHGDNPALWWKRDYKGLYCPAVFWKVEESKGEQERN
jgi:lipase maturation factor 1